MEDEIILSGYCRCLDDSRMVILEQDGRDWTADCQFGSCPYEGACNIAEEIQKIKQGK